MAQALAPSAAMSGELGEGSGGGALGLAVVRLVLILVGLTFLVVGPAAFVVGTELQASASSLASDCAANQSCHLNSTGYSSETGRASQLVVLGIIASSGGGVLLALGIRRPTRAPRDRSTAARRRADASGTRFCPWCGAQVTPPHAYCRACGRPLG